MEIILATCGFILCYGNNRKIREFVSLVFRNRARGCSQAGGDRFGSTAPMCQFWEALSGKVKGFPVLTPVQGVFSGFGQEISNKKAEWSKIRCLILILIAEFKSGFQRPNSSQCWWVLLCFLIILLLLYYYICAFLHELHYFRYINYSLLSILLYIYSQTPVLEGIWHQLYRMWPFDP